MTIPEKLAAILRLSGFSQTELAGKLGVSFVALNRWKNGKAVPRRKALERIDAIFREYTGLKDIPEEALTAKKGIITAKKKSRRNVLQTILSSPDIRDQLVLVLTYTSNSIEGSTLTEAQTAVVLFQDATLPGKTLTEQLEVKNHQAALLYLFDHVYGEKPADEELILKLHAILMNGILPDAGRYRRHAVRIVGADVPTTNHLSVPSAMEKLVTDIVSPGDDDGIGGIASVHARFEQIHPFADGNGRVGRLLMHAMLLLRNLPPVVIRPERKRLYYAFLNKAQRSGDTSLLEDFLCDGVLDGWDIVERRDVRRKSAGRRRRA